MAGQDYTPVPTIVSFAPGDTTPKLLTIAIADDARGEADETLVLALSAPTGGAVLGANKTTTVTIRDNDPPEAPASFGLLTVSDAIKQLNVHWDSVPGATTYRVLVNPDGLSGFTPVSGLFLGEHDTSATFDVSLHRLVNAQYAVEACNTRGCAMSRAFDALSVLNGAIGYFKASNPGRDDNFGLAVAISADARTLVVAAPLEDGSGGETDDRGAVYVFVRAGTQWSQQALLRASNAGKGDLFGAALDLSADGNTLVVGAPFERSSASGVNGGSVAEQDDSAERAGAVYIFARNSNGAWSQQAYAKASNTDADDRFGTRVQLSGDGRTLAVGAMGESSAATGVGGPPENQLDNSAFFAGAVYVFTRSNENVWTQEQYLKPSNTGASDLFGSALALSDDGNTLAVSAFFEGSSAVGVNPGSDAEQNNDFLGAGAVYVFARSPSHAWSQQAYVKASNTGALDRFGLSLDLSADGNELAVGAPGEASAATGIVGPIERQLNDDAPGAGAVYIFARDASGVWSQQEYVKASNAEKDDAFGESIALSADGETLAVGAILESSSAVGVGGDQLDSSAVKAGAAYVFVRSGTQWSQQAYVKAANTDQDDFFGVAIALSADGSVLAVGAYGEDSADSGVAASQNNNDAESSGAVYLY
jgi:hypothetical protein